MTSNKYKSVTFLDSSTFDYLEIRNSKKDLSTREDSATRHVFQLDDDYVIKFLQKPQYKSVHEEEVFISDRTRHSEVLAEIFEPIIWCAKDYSWVIQRFITPNFPIDPKTLFPHARNFLNPEQFSIDDLTMFRSVLQDSDYSSPDGFYPNQHPWKVIVDHLDDNGCPTWILILGDFISTHKITDLKEHNLCADLETEYGFKIFDYGGNSCL